MALEHCTDEAKCHSLFSAGALTQVVVTRITAILLANMALKQHDAVLTKVHSNLTFELWMELLKSSINNAYQLFPLDLITKTAKKSSCDLHDEAVRKVVEELDKFLASQSPPAPDIVIMGDFNLPHGDWSGGESAQGAAGDEGDMVRALNELTSSHFLVQQVECPTHKDGGMLDLIFTNNGDLIHNFNVLPSPKSDHFLIEVSAVCKELSVSEVEHSSMTDVVDGRDPDFVDPNFFSEKIDWNALEMELDRCMGCLDFRGLSSSFMMDKFLSTCLSVAREFVPLRKILPKHKHKIPKDRIILMRRWHRIVQQ